LLIAINLFSHLRLPSADFDSKKCFISGCLLPILTSRSGLHRLFSSHFSHFFIVDSFQTLFLLAVAFCRFSLKEMVCIGFSPAISPIYFSHLKGINIFRSAVDFCENSNPEMFMQYNYQPIKGKNVSKVKELAKNDFALTFFPYCIFIIYSVPN